MERNRCQVTATAMHSVGFQTGSSVHELAAYKTLILFMISQPKIEMIASYKVTSGLPDTLIYFRLKKMSLLL